MLAASHRASLSRTRALPRSCYRAPFGLSTRLLLGSTIFICLAVARVALPADSAARAPDSADELPAGALKNAPSLYLREAAASPIRWQPWDDASFALARKLNRPALVEVGAVWCHWCHVMDQTTYADPKVIDLINRFFVPIKVDTDERPDIDSYYQAAAQTFGSGGWPLFCLVTPDGAPLFIAGYMPAEAPSNSRGYGMVYVLERARDAYAQDPNFRELGRKLAAELARPRRRAETGEATPKQLREQILTMLAGSYSRKSGGFNYGPGPRFPDFPAIRLALAHGFFSHPEFTAMALTSLRKIAAGGICDQLGGGFHRYSTDPDWRVPHFEKMAYDQALALEAYAEAYADSHDDDFAHVARSIAGYVNGTLLDPATHTFYAHQDADSFAGDDGGYYTWTADEVTRGLRPDQAKAALLYFGFDDSPALAPDGRVVLRRAMDLDTLARKLGGPNEKAAAVIAQARSAMLAVRERRKKPQVDRAVMTDRNALMAEAYLAASGALGDDALKRIALDDLDFILSHMRARDGGYYHIWSNGRAAVAGLVADQVYLMNALIAAYQASSEVKYLNEARSLAALVTTSYRDASTGLLVNRAAALKDSVVASAAPGAQQLYDMEMPSAQAAAAIGLAALAAITSDDGYARLASALLAGAPAMIGPAPGTAPGTVGLALEERADGDAVVAIAGDRGDARTQALLRTALAAYRPGKVVVRVDASRVLVAGLPAPVTAMYAASRGRNVPLAFVCAGTACANPVDGAAKLAQTIKSFGVASAARTWAPASPSVADTAARTVLRPANDPKVESK